MTTPDKTLDIEEAKEDLRVRIDMLDGFAEDSYTRYLMRQAFAAIEQLQAAFDKARFDAHTSAHDVERLQAENAELQRTVPAWIPVNERLPEEGVCRLACCNRSDLIVMALYRAGLWFDVDGNPDPWTDVTHWMPLPTPPAQGESHEQR